VTEDSWDILGMEPTESTRDIKRAYAKKLKNTRPDDDPFGFQQLHNAYKTALYIAQMRADGEFETSYDDAESINITFEDGQLIESEGWPEALQNFIPDKPEITLSDEHGVVIDELMLHVDNLLAIPSGVHSTSRWRFLTECPDLLDDDFRVELGRRVMTAIISFNNKPRPRSMEFAPVSAAVITMLDDIFFWSSTPFMFTDPATLSEVFEIIAIVDPGLRQVTARPVGGRIVGTIKSKKPEDQGALKYIPSDSGFDPDVLWILFFVGYFILRSCADI